MNLARRILNEMALPTGLTHGQLSELTYCLHCWDEILVKEGLPKTVLRLVPDFSKTAKGDCDGTDVIRVTIIVIEKDKWGEPALDCEAMQITFLHELAHAQRFRDAPNSRGVHDKKWQLQYNKNLAKYAHFAFTDQAKANLLAKTAASKYSPPLKPGHSYYKEPVVKGQSKAQKVLTETEEDGISQYVKQDGHWTLERIREAEKLIDLVVKQGIMPEAEASKWKSKVHLSRRQNELEGLMAGFDKRVRELQKSIWG